jgi:hypothetical protein
VRSESVRLWLGPQIGLGYDWQADSDVDFYRIGANIGPALGLDIHLGSAVTLAISAFGRYGVYSVKVGDEDLTDLDGDRTEWQAGANFAILF